MDRIPVGATRSSALVQTGPGAHPDSYAMSTGAFPGIKWPGRGADHPPTLTSEVKEILELYLYSLSGPSWPVLGWPLPLCMLRQDPQNNIKFSSFLTRHALRLRYEDQQSNPIHRYNSGLFSVSYNTIKRNPRCQNVTCMLKLVVPTVTAVIRKVNEALGRFQ